MLLEFFLTCNKIGAFTLGGGYAMIPIMEREFVDKHQWMDRQEFMDIMVVAQTTPGIFAIDMASHIGYKLRGVWGGIVGALGIALPSIIAIMVIAMFFQNFKDNEYVAKLLQDGEDGEHNMAHGVDTGGVCGADMAAGRVADIYHHSCRLGRISLWNVEFKARKMIFLKLFIIFTKIGTFNFGGGYAMLSLIHNETVVKNAWLTNSEFTDIVAISQSTPGPIGINAATYVGYTAVLNQGYPEWMAMIGSVLASLSIIWLPFIIMILISRYLMTHRDSKAVKSVFAGLRPAIIGLIAAASLLLMTKDNFGSPKDEPIGFGISVALFAVTFFLTRYRKTNPILVMLCCGVLGLLVF